MPLNDGTGYTFSESGILASAPKKSGVYVIYNQAQWIYVGEAQDIELRLLSHQRGESDQSPRILRQNPTGFDFETCDAATRVTRERYWINKLDPVCNRS